MISAHCQICHGPREFEHLHDTAHGLPGTHMAGSERFQCSTCRTAVHVDDNGGRFFFQLDGEDHVDG